MAAYRGLFFYFFVSLILHQAFGEQDQTAWLSINAANERPISNNFFGIFFEEINHAGAGGIWSELVSNRGFEAGGRHSPSMITPWDVIGDDDYISITTELSSCFERNKVALRMDVHCDQACPSGGVGVYNPGYWGMNVEEGKTYKLVLYTKSSGPLDLKVSLTDENATQVFASTYLTADAAKVKEWTKMEMTLKAKGSSATARLQLTTTSKGTIWLDQVSLMPTDTYKGHGFRPDLMEKLLALKPRFFRFPGGCYVEGNWLQNAYRWKETVGPWEERPGHMGDVWNYWSDDGLGYLEYLQMAEDLDAEPVWVINNGISHKDEVETSLIKPFVQEMLDSIEFARGSANSTWGSLRAKIGHPKPFKLNYVAIGNEDCGKKNYRGNYLKFYDALKSAYPDIKAISNCDGSQKQPLDHPTDLYDFHTYTNPQDMLKNMHIFANKSREGPKAFVSEYAVTYPREKQINGTFRAALAESAFLLSLEKNSDIVDMVSYAPLFLNTHDKTWVPDAILFNSNQSYNIPSYWVQTFFIETSGATLLDSHLHTNSTGPLVTTAIKWKNSRDNKEYIRVKVMNYHSSSLEMRITFDGVDSVRAHKQVELHSDELDAYNSFEHPTKVAPTTVLLNSKARKYMDVVVKPYSLTSFDMLVHNKNAQPPKHSSKFDYIGKLGKRNPGNRN